MFKAQQTSMSSFRRTGLLHCPEGRNISNITKGLADKNPLSGARVIQKKNAGEDVLTRHLTLTPAITEWFYPHSKQGCLFLLRTMTSKYRGNVIRGYWSCNVTLEEVQCNQTLVYSYMWCYLASLFRVDSFDFRICWGKRPPLDTRGEAPPPWIRGGKRPPPGYAGGKRPPWIRGGKRPPPWIRACTVVKRIKQIGSNL